MSSFYIGYLPDAPSDVRRFVRRVVVVLGALAVSAASILVLAQQQFSPAFFQFRNAREFIGTFHADPYPSLLVHDPATGRQTRLLLSAVGKHSFHEGVVGAEGKLVRLHGKLIYRNEGAMIEVVPNTFSIFSSPSESPSSYDDRVGSVTLIGEIVDTKCFLGVMNPGRGKVHHDCAARCISGGIPPALLVQTADSSDLYSLTTPNGGPIDPKQILQYVGEPVRVVGTLMTERDSHAVRVKDLRPLN